LLLIVELDQVVIVLRIAALICFDYSKLAFSELLDLYAVGLGA